MDVLIVILGGLLVIAVGRQFSKLFNKQLQWENSDSPAGVDPDEWRAALLGPGPGAAYIGRLESLLVYLSVVYATADAGLIVGGWFAFKVASKWEMWTNVVKMPDQFEGATALESLRARRKLGYVMYDRFLIGTLVNVMSGAVIAGLVLRFSPAILILLKDSGLA